MEITDAWLMEMGGWQEVKRARAMWSAGAVSEAAFDGKRLTGSVRDSGKVFSSGLLLRSRSDMDNLCNCFQSRRDGTLCAHSLAVGTAWARRHEKPPGGSGGAAGASSSAMGAGTGSPSGGAGRTGAGGGMAGPPAVKPAKADGVLSFFLTPNFFTGLQRQRLTVVVETGKGGSESERQTQAKADSPVLAWLGSLQQSTVPPHLMLSAGPQIAGLLEALAGHTRVFLRGGGGGTGPQPFTVTPEPARLMLTLVTPPSGQTVRLSLKPPQPDAQLIPPATEKETGWLWQPSTLTLQPLRVPAVFFELLSALPPRPPAEKSRRWLAGHLAALQNVFDLDTAGSSPEVLSFHLVPGTPRFELELEGSLTRLSGKLRCRYPDGPAAFPPLAREVAGFPLESGARPGVFLTRNQAAEAAAVRRLENCGFTLATSGAEAGGSGDFLLSPESAILQFFAGELERLKADWQVTTGSRFTAATANVERLSPQWKPVGSGTDWLSFDLAFASPRGTVLDRVEIARLLATGSGHKKLPNGRTAVISLTDAMDLNEVLRDVQPDQSSGSFRVKKSQAGYLEQTFGRPLEPGRSTAPAWPLESSVPPALTALLRDYQKTGVQWLLDRAGQNMGGILADEMGLGKTLQSLSLMAALRRQWPDRPCLVVCPKSLLGNWRAEAARFTPELTCLTLEGVKRKGQFAAVPKAAIVLTSYQLLARDIEEHRAIQWGAVILDEAGFIRNPDTQAAKAARALQAGARFALTGTPIENGMRDLWSLMEFALPGCLGTRKDFQERYETPLAAGGNAPVMARLRRRLAPHLLRRLKQEVAKDLPSKIEKVHACELTAVQRELYAGLMREGAAKVMDAESAKQQGQARMHLLTTLLRLRQICCDPALLPVELPGPPTPEADRSGKLEAVAELLEEIRDGGHSVIIFSAFASMLRQLETTVKSAGLGYCLLDGRTQDRTALVSSFQNDPDKRVFLISLKAGGYGLNLTKADTVIHFDPWWNPAVEAQATDRAHRIGQDRPVTVYKLITTGTVEEKILNLQRKKRGMMDAALDDEAPLMDGLTDGELRDLLEI
ncbi:MAG: hypothetical protein JWM59_4820 [Verrucomicrobiales bacterium]|nr:hypothetical protein [Verrucomicrobiales bacterium]